MSHSPELMLVRNRMEPGWVGALHSHPHQQIVYVVSGHLHFRLAEERHELKAGDSLYVPGGVAHSGSSTEGCEVLDIFTPLREDYLPKSRERKDREQGNRDQ
jgi:quercetin dioxygenase-like cupin family protein